MKRLGIDPGSSDTGGDRPMSTATEQILLAGSRFEHHRVISDCGNFNSGYLWFFNQYFIIVLGIY